MPSIAIPVALTAAHIDAHPRRVDVDPLPRLVQDMAIEELQTAAVELDRAPGVGFE